MNEIDDEKTSEITENIDSEIDSSAESQIEAEEVADQIQDAEGAMDPADKSEEVSSEEVDDQLEETESETSQSDDDNLKPEEEVAISDSSDEQQPVSETETAAESESEDTETPSDDAVEESQPALESHDLSEDPKPAADLKDDSPKPQAEVMSNLADDDEVATVVEEEEKTPPPLDHEDGREWYVVHCYSGYENKVRHNLEQRIESMGMKDLIFDVVVPTEEEIEVKDGKRRIVERRVFPGYILVNMVMGEEPWYVVRNTPGVTSFVGMGEEPIPLRPEEVSQIIKRMESDAPRIKVTFKSGERVRIVDGPFNDFRGTVEEIDMDRAKVRVMVNFFGRETPVELDFLQVEKS